jgi:hypothetical protein
MIQFLAGLVAGALVGLVMEWIVDWRALAPRQTRPAPPDRRAENRNLEQLSEADASAASTPETTTATTANGE